MKLEAARALELTDRKSLLTLQAAELVAGVEFRVIARAGLPHFPEDF